MKSRVNFQVSLIALHLLILMFPVTGVVPVLKQITADRFPDISIFDKHLFMSMNMIGAFIFVPVSALISDYLNNRKLLISVSFLINGVILYLMPMAENYNTYLTLRFIEGCAHITSLNLLMAMGVDNANRGNSGKVMGLVGSAISIGVAVGAPIGGLIGHENPMVIFELGSYLMIFLAFTSYIFLNELPITYQNTFVSALIKSVTSEKRFLAPFIFTMVDRFTVGFIVSSLTLFLATKLSASPKEIGLIIAAFMIPFSLLIFPIGKWSENKNKLKWMIIGSIIYGIILIFLTFVSLTFILVLMIIAGIVSAIMYAPSLVMVSKLSSSSNKALSMSGFNCAGSIGFILGPLVGGLIINNIDGTILGIGAFQIAFIIAGISEIACAIVFYPWLKKISI